MNRKTVPMRIALIVPPWVPVPPPSYGGLEAVVHALAVELKRAGHLLMLFTVGGSTCPVPRSWRFRAPQVEMGNVRIELCHVMAAYEAAVGFDIVHDHTVAGPVDAERFPDVAVVHTLHGAFDEATTEICRRVAPRVPLIAISEAQRRQAPLIPVAGVIHHGVMAEEFPIGKGDGGYCVFIGRMSHTKGVHLAIDAARHAGVDLVIAAKMRTAEEHAYFAAEVEPRLGGHARYVGEVDFHDKVALLGGARALVFPITWPEPFGMVMIEALACGTPVLAFPSGSAPEVVDHGITGLLCADVDEMASAIAAASNLDRAACRAAAEGRFSARRMAKDHVALYDSVLSGGPPPPLAAVGSAPAGARATLACTSERVGS